MKSNENPLSEKEQARLHLLEFDALVKMIKGEMDNMTPEEIEAEKNLTPERRAALIREWKALPPDKFVFRRPKP